MQSTSIFERKEEMAGTERKKASKQKSIINRSELKKYILKMTDALRPGWDCQRVSASAMNDIEAFMMNRVRDAVRKHPTVGKTFKDFQ
jgi:hypothetical protein